MRDKQLIKVSVPITIATELQSLPEYEGMTLTQIIKNLTLNKLQNSADEHREDNHGKQRT